MKTDWIELKAIPFARVLAHYGVELREDTVSGDLKLVGRCPLHTDGRQARNRNHLQITVRSEKHPRTSNSFHCFSCKARGTVLDFVVLIERWVKTEDVDWDLVKEKRASGNDTYNWCPVDLLKRAAQVLRELNGSGRPPEAPTMPQDEGNADADTPTTHVVPPGPQTPNKTWEEVWGKNPTYHKFYEPCPYLESRGIAPEVLSEFGVGYYTGKSRLLTGQILFPILSGDGELLAFAWRNLETEGQRYSFPPIERFNRSLELWNLHRAKNEGKHVYVVEGFFGAMNLYQNGWTCVVALMGSNLSPAQATRLMNDFECATFILDPDSAGRKLKSQVVSQLLHAMPIRIVEPDKQADSMTTDELSALLR